MDEAAARLRMAVDSKPEALDELDRRIMQLKIEREALKKEPDEAPASSGSTSSSTISPASRTRRRRCRSKWLAEKERVQGSQKLKEELDAARSQLEIAQRAGDFAKAGELAYARDPRARKAHQGSRSRRATAEVRRWCRRR